MLEVQIRSLNLENKVIMENSSISIKPGTISLLSGNNGVGKSTLAKAIMGFEGIVIKGKVILDKMDITNLPTHNRVRKGIFLTHQNPQEITGISLLDLLRASYLKMEYIDEKVDLRAFNMKVVELAESLGVGKEMLDRDVNYNFSGGEKKKAEFLQAMILQPKYLILDEIDSGLDTRSKTIISKIINKYAQNGMGILIISHREDIKKSVNIDVEYKIEGGKVQIK